jgi:hypothetical protein
MKRGFRALAVLAAVAAMSAGPAAFAGCSDFGGFAVFQCADRAYFEPAPAGSGTVTPVFWQIGYGNQNVNDGSGASGTGIGGGGAFNGNDQGVFDVGISDALTAIGAPGAPAGALCLSVNNWANTGIDGCCDNPKDSALPVSKDGILNPLYDVNYVRNYGYDPNTNPSNKWVQDSPIAALLRESNGHYFAFVATSTLDRFSIADPRPGAYYFKDVDNGHVNPYDGTKHNVIPWQKVPGYKAPGDAFGLVRDVSDANMPNATHNVTLGWDDVVVYQDHHNRPSTNVTVSTGDEGSAFVGPLVRYVVETQAIVNPNNPVGSLNPNGWTAAGTFHNPANSAVISVGPDTCVRLHTYLGHEPTVLPPNQNSGTCRVGECGDLGYDVASPASCVGGPLVSETPVNLSAIRERAGAVSITWKAAAELTTTSYRVEAITKKGATVLGTVPATATGSGASASYKFSASVTQLKGTRTIQVVALPSGAKQSVQIQ